MVELRSDKNRVFSVPQEVNGADHLGVPLVEMYVSVPGLRPKGSFEGDSVKMEVDLNDKATVRTLSEAMAKIPGQLHKAFFTGERKGWVYLGLGGMTLLVGLGVWELKERRGEDILHFGEKLREARIKLFKEPTQ